MTKKAAFKDFAIYCSLNVFGMMGISLYILADTFFVSKGLGLNGLAALNLALPIYGFIRGIGVMLGMGGATKYSVLRVQEKPNEANAVFTNTIVLATFFSVIYVLIGVFLSNKISLLLGANSSVFSMTNTYIKTLLLAAPVFIFSDILIFFVRNDHNPRLSMFAMLGGSLFNIMLDYVFIFVFDMGIFGAVFATVISTILGIGILSLHILQKKNCFHLVKGKIRPSVTVSVMALGLPGFIAEISSSVVLLIFNLIVLNLEGNVGVAAFGVVANLSFIVGSIYIGISQGMQPLTSRAHGIGDKDTIRRLLRFGLITVAILSVLIYAVIYIFASQIAHNFNGENNEQLQKIAELGLKIYFTAVIFLGFNTVSSAFFTSIEKAKPAQIISLLRGLIIIIPMAYLISYFWGITGVWLSFPASELIVSVATITLLILSKKYWGKHSEDSLPINVSLLIDPSDLNNSQSTQ